MTIKIPVFIADEKINSKYLHGHVLLMHTLKDRTMSGRKSARMMTLPKLTKNVCKSLAKYYKKTVDLSVLRTSRNILVLWWQI